MNIKIRISLIFATLLLTQNPIMSSESTETDTPVITKYMSDVMKIVNSTKGCGVETLISQLAELGKPKTEADIEWCKQILYYAEKIENIHDSQSADEAHQHLVEAVINCDLTIDQMIELRREYKEKFPQKAETQEDRDARTDIEKDYASIKPLMQIHNTENTNTLSKRLKELEDKWSKHTKANTYIGYLYRAHFGPASVPTKHVYKLAKTKVYPDPTAEELEIIKTMESASEQIVEEDKAMHQEMLKLVVKMKKMATSTAERYNEISSLFSSQAARTSNLGREHLRIFTDGPFKKRSNLFLDEYNCPWQYLLNLESSLTNLEKTSAKHDTESQSSDDEGSISDGDVSC